MKRTKSFFIALLAAFSVAGGYAKPVTVGDFKFNTKSDGTATLMKIVPDDDWSFYEEWTEYAIPGTIVVNENEYLVTSIGDNAFQVNAEGETYVPAKLRKLELPYTIKEIGSSAFAGITSLQTVDIKGASVEIGSFAFSGCTKLSTFNAKPTSIGEFAFERCVGLTEIDLSETTSIGAYAFSTTALETLELPSSLESLGNNAFEKCASLESLELNATFTSDNIFSGCGKLKNVTFGESVTNIPDGLLAGTAVSSVAFPEGLTSIGANAFKNTELAEVEIPASVASIGASAFEGTRLEEVEIPASVTSIGASAFYGCSLLETANFVSNPEIVPSAFPKETKRILTIDDAKAKERAFDDTKDNKFTTIIYKNRTFTSEKYASLMLPFVPAAEVLDQFEIYELGEMEGDCLYFNQVTEFVAGTPYLVKVKDGNDAVNELSAEEAVIVKGDHESAVNNVGWKMIGVYKREVLDGANSEAAGKKYYYYTSAQNAFLYSQGTLGVNPYRMYVEAPVTSSAKVRMMTRGLDGETTAIEMEEIEDLLAPAIDAYYDLNGCRVLNPVEGNMYIVNGKKIVF